MASKVLTLLDGKKFKTIACIFGGKREKGKTRKNKHGLHLVKKVSNQAMLNTVFTRTKRVKSKQSYQRHSLGKY